MSSVFRMSIMVMVAVLIFGSFATTGAWAGPPQEINIQGKLEAAGGGPLSGPYELRVRFFDSPVASAELQMVTMFADLSDAGRFSIALPFDPVLLATDEVWYELALDSNGDTIYDASEVFTDRVRVLSVPFALMAANTEHLAGVPAGEFSTIGNLDARLEEYWNINGNVWPTTQTRVLGSHSESVLEIIVGGQPTLRFVPTAGSPNIIGGHPENNTGLTNPVGVVIGGGGNVGMANSVRADFGVIAGGLSNTASGSASFIGSGYLNIVGATASVVGGYDNAASGAYSFIGGGYQNSASGEYSAIGGGMFNEAIGDWHAIAGGYQNSASGSTSFVGAGTGNSAEGNDTFIGSGNSCIAVGDYISIAGGGMNYATGTHSAISGGYGGNALADFSVVGGGYTNIVTGKFTVIAGGKGGSASGEVAFIGGGTNNKAGGLGSVIAGGEFNEASGHDAVVVGGVNNLASGEYSFAAGRRAKARHPGSFVWADSTNSDFLSSATDQFAVRANGGMAVSGGIVDKAIFSATNLQSGPGASLESMFGHALVTKGPSIIQGPNPKQIAMLRWYDAVETGKTFPVGTNPGDIAFDGTNMWVCNYNADKVTVLQSNNGVVAATYATGWAPDGIAFDGKHMWIVNRGDETVTALNAGTGATEMTANTGGTPVAVAFDGSRIWVANNTPGNVTVVHAGSGAHSATYTVGTGPSAIAFDGTYMWVTCTGNAIHVLRADNGLQASFSPLTGVTAPEGIAFDGARMWVTSQISDTVTVIRAHDGVIDMTLGVADGIGDKPVAIAFDGSNMWITNADDDTVTILRARDGSLVDVVNTKDSPQGIAFDGANMWVTNSGSDNVSKF
jgi:hypothetical protein